VGASEPAGPAAPADVSETGFGGFKATYGSDPKAIAMFEPEGPGVRVTDIYRGGQPKGTGGPMLADALSKAGLGRPSFIRVTGILNEPTLQQLQAGVAPGETVLGGTIQNAAQALGGKVTSFSQGVENG
jgi:hypothetical protein